LRAAASWTVPRSKFNFEAFQEVNIMNFVPFVILWVVLALAVLALFIWRRTVSGKEDDNLYLDGTSAAKAVHQEEFAKKLNLIDKWGKIATVLAVVYGVVLGGIFVWMSWVQNTKTGA
jgi:ABC-type Fe3+ transport system permease subunit